MTNPTMSKLGDSPPDEESYNEIEPHKALIHDDVTLEEEALIKKVEWNGSAVITYPLDYKRVPMVKRQILVCFLLFAILGLNDQSTGSLLPTLVNHYKLSKIKVSNIFILQATGYITASLLNDKVHKYGGSRGCILGAIAICFVFYAILALRPAYFAVYLCCYFPLGLALGLIDATCNILVGNLEVNKNELMGLLHGVYSGSAMLTPPIVSYFVEWGHWPLFFVIPVTVAVICGILAVPNFRYETAVKYDYICKAKVDANDSDTLDTAEGLAGTTDTGTDTDTDTGMLAQLKSRPVLLYSSFLFVYLGAEVTTGSWLFTYLLETKMNNPVRMSYIVSTFWVGLTVGRVVLGFVTGRVFRNEYRAGRVYSICTLALFCMFVLVGATGTSTGEPQAQHLQPTLSLAYFLSLMLIIFLSGFFIGPLFPIGSVVALQLLPKSMHVSGIGVATSLGSCGTALLPYMAGVIIQLVGMWSMPLISCLLVASFTLVWCMYPYLIRDHPEYL